ncbi:protein-disulfide reductase DsbD domain-containing protein [Pseudomarimonas salicorniae]|uniref:Thioredoxin family protein n=1 Tax=Pseudomarimonas salicorniae TaxID=2933270 RepID=A0ABT0GCP1_9GAMM|nr:protein-disulfide reductase DsbD domain-containing protein [Lysobacter sp. CAU 1642]MCK7592213.1 thioredoxin family protein [Lysobacter sp. CAU 1642]
MLKLLSWPLLALALLAPAQAAVDESDLLPVDEAFVLTHEVEPDGNIVLRWDIAEGYYLYRHRFAVEAEPGFRLDSVVWPPGTPHEDEFFGKTETYRGSVTARLLGAPEARTARLALRYQGCADLGICYPPQKRSLEVALPDGMAVAPAPALPIGLPAGPSSPLLPGAAPPSGGVVDAEPLPPEQAFGVEAIANSGGELLLRFTPAPGYYLYRDKTRLALRETEGIALGVPGWPEATPHRDEHFGEVMVYFDQVEVPLPLRRARGEAMRLVLDVEIQGCQTDGICYPPMQRVLDIALPAADPASLVDPVALAGEERAPASGGETLPHAGLALLFALLGGLILNLMPCVLPVLSFKLIGLAESRESVAAARRHALWYTAGVLLSFAAIGLGVLALREGGQALGWGFQLQQPAVVAGLVYVMLAVGLSLSGLFQIGAGLAGAGQSLAQRGGRSGDFFTGVLAVVVATPCTAPFMGGALAFAFAAPPLLALAVFLALGLGLALPFLLIGLVPALGRLLPRPGAWMETLKQLLAFPMYLTAVWLVWVLAKQRGADAVGWVLIGATLLGLAGWALGQAQQRARRWGLALGVAALLAAMWPLFAVSALPAAPSTTAQRSSDGSEPYSAAALAEARRAGRVVFVNMTADWCVTCKANEKSVLSGAAFAEAMQASGAVYLKGDWTNVDPAITAFLEDHGAVGVPLYVVFPADGGDGRRLPTLLTDAIVTQALEDARR